MNLVRKVNGGGSAPVKRHVLANGLVASGKDGCVRYALSRAERTGRSINPAVFANIEF